jgi:cycloeucalenol cycloisomerase
VDPNRAWAERFFLLYTPVWIGAVALVMVTGWMRHWGDSGYLAFGFALALPPVVLPYVLAPTKAAKDYAARFNLWIFVFSFFGNYFICRYFEDVLGLRYGFPTETNLGALTLGRQQEKIPFTLYLMTQAYFLTYHAAIFVTWRRFGRTVPMLVLGCCFFAFAETASMATPLLSGLFWYTSMQKMLTIGTLMYGSLFLVSVPMLYKIEPATPWRGVWLSVLAANMIQFWVFEAWARVLL